MSLIIKISLPLNILIPAINCQQETIKIILHKINTHNDIILFLVNITTGYELPNPKVITITNEGNTEITYNIKLTSINTQLLSTNNLVYTLTKNNENAVSKELPLTETNIISNVKIGPKETNTYLLSVKFNGILDLGVTHNYSASVVVEQTGTKANLLE